MPRYFFHVQDGHQQPDREGSELVSTVAARHEAMRVAGRMLDDEGMLGKLGEDWTIEVTDERGLVLFRLDFHVTSAPAISEARGPR